MPLGAFLRHKQGRILEVSLLASRCHFLLVLSMQRNRLRRILLAIVAVPFVLIVALVCWYFLRLYIGYRMVESAGAEVKTWGGYIQRGNVDGDYYVHLEDTAIDDAKFARLVDKLNWFPPPYLDQKHEIEIYADNTRITDQSIFALRNISIRALDVHNTAISDPACL